MKVKKICTTIILFCLAMSFFLVSGCAPSPEETEQEKRNYEKKYATEAEPVGDVARLLKVLDGCVGGQYIIGGQGKKITSEFIDKMYEKYPNYFSDGRLEYIKKIADGAKKNGWSFPKDYSWDCSGLWWYAASDVLNLYGETTDRTAQDTYDNYCTPITKDELRPGDLAFIEGIDGKIAHMGIMGRHGYIYEAASGFCGVVLKRTIDKRVYYNIVNGGSHWGTNWNKFGRPKIFE
jgi:cell wall-associated NlpC family hydrolase